MLKLRLAAGVLTAAAALAVPAAAFASAYTPISYDDADHDVTGPSGTHYPEPALDIVGVHGERYRNNFSIAVTYRDLTPLTYTRYLTYLADPNAPEGSAREYILELRSSNPSSYHVTTLYYAKPGKTADAPPSIAKVACSDVRAVPNYTANTITYTLPVSCYHLDPNSAILAASSGKWLQRTWMQGSLRAGDRPNLSDTAENPNFDENHSNAWTWSNEAKSTRSARGSLILF